MKLLAWAKSDTGRRRDHNEDNFLVDVPLGLFAVADGMGGHQGGETASRLALDVMKARIVDARGDLIGAARRIEDDRRRDMLRTTAPMDALEETRPITGRHERERDFEPQPWQGEVPTDPLIDLVQPPALVVMRAAARDAGHTIYDTAIADANLRGMGTTLTAMLYDAGRMHVVHAGDSRAYLFRDGTLRQITEDHSWIAEQVKSGNMTEAEAKESKFRHVITRSVGFERDVEVDVRGIVAEAGDCFLLCSDGMSNHVDNSELERVLSTTWYRRAPQYLIDLANQRGGDDNITVVVCCIANDLS